MLTQEETHASNRTIEEAPSPSVDPKILKSRFFRTKRKQRANQSQINGTEEMALSSESTKTRSRSPPPSIAVTDESDHDEYEETDLSFRTTKDISNASLAQHRSSLADYSNYPRLKSHSVKSINLDEQSTSPKKAVRFADDFGLNLSQMRVINTDELPFVPTEAFKHLKLNCTDCLTSNERFKQIIYMDPLFENPLYTYGFMDRVHQQKIVLEQANAIDNRIYGTIRLIPFGLHKRVKIRLTTDNWITFHDYDANYIDNSYDGTCDRFSFTIEIDRDRICLGNNIQFCLSYESFGGPNYWDNNYGQNYRLNCYSRTIPDFSL